MIFIGIAAAVFFLDYAVKKWAEKELKGKKRRPIGKTGFSLKLIHNRGFACNKMEGNPERVKRIHGLILVFLGCYSLFSIFLEKGRELTALGFALILGGGCSNFYDRCKKGFVTDYLGLPVFKKLLFNLSDLLIFLGGILIFIGEWKQK